MAPDMVISSQRPSDQFDCEYEEKIVSTHWRRRRLWRKVRYQLTDYHALPTFLRDNEHILSHYRSQWPLKQLLLSIFTIHNETLNVWTHLIGFFLFLSLTVYTAMEVPDVVERCSLQQSMLLKCLPSLSNLPDFSTVGVELKASLPTVNSLVEHLSYLNQTGDNFLLSMKEDVINTIAPLTCHPITRWPFYTFLGGAMLCLLASTSCHLLNCHSERLSYIMHRLDYAGIAALIATSFYPPVYYSFICSPFFFYFYLGFITILGIATVIFALFPFFQNPEFRKIRASLFFGMGVSGAVPILHKLVLYWNQPEALQTTGYEVLMGVFYGMGALIYAMRIPERWRPGKFDIAGQSHQLFHVLVVAGAYTHYHAGLVYLKWRDIHSC